MVGLGYIGLPTAAILATHGCSVVGVDIRSDVVAAVNRGEVPFVEPDLDIAVTAAVTKGALVARSSVPVADVYIVAVPTPLGSDRTPDLSFVEKATAQIAAVLRGGELVILESTSPPGTTRKMSEIVASLRPELKGSILFAHCPERVLPGRMMVELIENDRIIGGLTSEAAESAMEVYATFCRGELIPTTATTAETAKLVENAYRDVNIAFANELSMLSTALDINVWELISLANHHPRVNILNPGPGVGGHCIAVDPWFLVDAVPEHSLLIKQARLSNLSKTEFVFREISTHVGAVGVPAVLVLGVSYKADVDDLRESPAIEITEALAKEHPTVSFLVRDPFVVDLPVHLRELPNVSLVDSIEMIPDSAIVCGLVGHSDFRNLDLSRFDPENVFDVCGIWPSTEDSVVNLPSSPVRG
ncbi:UDP-N-acetyl-D-mannosaminuronic acid dehydrogenase [Arthrobacter cupressi]|uniref:UDP-N-acetyl-D-mannosaminuronic acid dehydrogenase n=1 Tax=Arthrobacter cupressi TaxID=1045773 RepID=A0A1G8UKC1_9MICC|nr:UDP-N-acetyl-D-mannosaminuronic acid dehydrogenase [Arthrobacter cupressi]